MKLMQGDCLERMAEIETGSVDLTVTSPPYNIGKAYESVTDLKNYIAWQANVIREVSRVTREGGSICWQVGNYVAKGCVYPIDCLLFPVFISEGLLPRNRIVWSFGHGLHCKKRFSGRHETILWFTKGNDYTFNLDDVRVPSKYPAKKHYRGAKAGQLSGNPLGKNPEDVWTFSNVKHNHPEKTAHPCQFPVSLVDRIVKAMSSSGQTVFDPFMGSGTTGVACVNTGRNFIGIERDPDYFKIAQDRISVAMGVAKNANDDLFSWGGK